MSRTILVPLDGSPFAERALPLALALARRSRAGIHLLTVAIPSPVTFEGGLYVCPAELDAERSAACNAYATRTLDRLRAKIDVHLSVETIFGDAASTLCAVAGSGKYDLVVMATHGRTGLSRFWLGSMADELVRHVSVPVLLVRVEEEEFDLDEEPDLGEEPDLSRILVSLDGSPLAEQILESASAVAAMMPDSEIVLVRVIPALAAYSATDMTDSLTYCDAEKYLKCVAARLTARGLKARTHVVFEDRPAHAILREAESEHAGLIALETHGRGGLVRLVRGSIADQVVHAPHVPVLVQRTTKV